MKRRAFLRLLGVGGLSGAAGCLDAVGLGSGIVETSVEHVDPARRRERKPIIVAFDEETTTVRILGWMYYGSSSCNRVGLESVDYDANEDHLQVVITSNSTQAIPFLPLGCTADMAATWYEARVRFAEALPQTVTVKEQGNGENAQRTVRRQAQRELCTTAHPTGSDAAKKAHWTCPDKYLTPEGSEF